MPLPDPALLALHAACCKVANMSGVTEWIQQHDYDLEDLKVLANDGTSADLLAYAIVRAIPVAGP
jgi:hypothetical protein